jgi:glycosyltransferase involved in cell wall biosynthesis
MSVSVILPTFNARPWIRDQLEALANQAYTDAWELVVADNGSKDQTPAIIARWSSRFPAFRLIDASDVRGQSHARNRAAHEASGDVLLFTDSDDIVTPQWMQRLTDGLSDSPIVTGPVAHFVNGAAPTGNDVLAPERRPQIGPFVALTGCNMGIARKVFLELGGFDETMTRSWEDVDLGIRAALRGLPTGWVIDALVLHRRPRSARAMWSKEFQYGRGWTMLERRYPQVSPNGWLRPLLRRAGWVAVRAPYLALPSRRGAWVVRAAGVAGRFAERVRSTA